MNRNCPRVKAMMEDKKIKVVYVNQGIIELRTSILLVFWSFETFCFYHGLFTRQRRHLCISGLTSWQIFLSLKNSFVALLSSLCFEEKDATNFDSQVLFGTLHNIETPTSKGSITAVVKKFFRISLLNTIISLKHPGMSVEIPIKEFVAWLWKHIVRHAGYISFNDKLDVLNHEWNALKARRDDVQSNAMRARNQNMEVLREVEHWMTVVGTMEDDVDVLIEISYRELRNTCLWGCCPKNCCSRYSLGKKISKELTDVMKLMEKGLFHYIATPVEEPFERTMRFLGTDNIGTIGLHGPAGVGKTTLLNQIGQNLLSSQHQFVHVMLVLVPHDLSLDKIQGDVGKEIGFDDERWKEKSRGEKAKDVNRVLRQDKFALLLDDLKDQVDLRSIGVPPPNENGSKVIFTTSSEEVCNKMSADEKIEVGSLTWPKSWALFQEKVGEDTMTSHPEIPKLAETVTRMCDGLPLAVVTIGRAMSGKKTPGEWHRCIEVLRKSIAEFSDTNFALLKFAFDSLPSRVKRCFLYCTLFPQDFSINRSKLIDCWIGEGFLDEPNHDHRGERSEGYDIIKTLLDACLLEEQGKDHVKMHEKIREATLWIACECGKSQGRYLVETEAKLSEAPDVRRLEVAKRISLMKNHIQNLTTTARCHDLLTLFLGHNDLRTISDTFFEFMSSVRVLDLSENRSFTELPPGISKLSSVECLDLSHTGIRQLPIEMKNLVKLKCLNLEHTYALLTIPMSLLSSFLELNVLRMGHSAFSGQTEGYGIQLAGFESFLRELQNLEHLNLLTISIKSGFLLQLLEAYGKFTTCTQALSLYSFRHTNLLDISFLEDMTLLDELDFNDCSILEELSFEHQLLTRTSGCFSSLRKVSIINCSKLKDLTWLALAPNLESLVVSRCSTMEEIISRKKLGDASLGEFTKLEVLKLVSLPKLKSIHPKALPFPCLKEIFVDGCQNLRKLPLASGHVREHRLVIHGWEGWWEKLEWEDEATKSTYSPCFKASTY